MHKHTFFIFFLNSSFIAIDKIAYEFQFNFIIYFCSFFGTICWNIIQISRRFHSIQPNDLKNKENKTITFTGAFFICLLIRFIGMISVELVEKIVEKIKCVESFSELTGYLEFYFWIVLKHSSQLIMNLSSQQGTNLHNSEHLHLFQAEANLVVSHFFGQDDYSLN